MGLLDGLERLINEHGSAAILKERTELANDKYSALESKVSDLTAKISDLESQISVLQNERSELQADNKRLKANNEQLAIQIQNLNKPITDHADLLDDNKVNILKLLFSCDRMPVNQIAQTLKLNLQFANFHLEELQKMKMIRHVSIYLKNVVTLTHGTLVSHDPVTGCEIEQKHMM